MGVEFLKIKESEEAKEIIQEKFDELYSPESMKRIRKGSRLLIFLKQDHLPIKLWNSAQQLKSALEHLFQMAPMQL